VSDMTIATRAVAFEMAQLFQGAGGSASLELTPIHSARGDPRAAWATGTLVLRDQPDMQSAMRVVERVSPLLRRRMGIENDRAETPSRFLAFSIKPIDGGRKPSFKVSINGDPVHVCRAVESFWKPTSGNPDYDGVSSTLATMGIPRVPTSDKLRRDLGGQSCGF